MQKLKELLNFLKLKYWADIPYQELIGNTSAFKNKSDISQRFYLFEGRAGIFIIHS